MSELDSLKVYGETEIGWCEKTKPNETVDHAGNINPDDRGFGVVDPRAPRRRRYDDESVCRLREHLRQHNGIQGLDICQPHQLDKAAAIFHRDGFVVVDNLLTKKQLQLFREGSARILKQILSYPGTDGRKYTTESNRLPHRYSYGTASASRQLLHDPVWSAFVDLETTTPILQKLFGSVDYSVIGAGGDLCLPGAIEYQHLHGDIQESFAVPDSRVKQAQTMDLDLEYDANGSLSGRSRRLIVDRTPPLITINFLMSDLTWENGPIRQIPGAHVSAMQPPTPEQEPEWMRLSTLVGAKAGAAMFRDNRGWHGATPNLSKEIRALPDVEYGAPWWSGSFIAKTMPHDIWESLSTHAKHICRFVKEDPNIWPAGAGVMHPLAEGRRKAKEATTQTPNP